MVLYARQSRYRDDSVSIPVQLEACREAAQRLGIEIIRELQDRESAYRDRGRGRPDWREMLRMIEAGEADGALVYLSDRLSRGGGPGYAPFWDACEKAGLDLDFVVATPNGFESEFLMAIKAEMDREFSKRLSGRMRDVKGREARSGRKNAGGRRSFGYHRSEKVRLDPESGDLLPCPSCGSMAVDGICQAEAEAVRQGAERVLSGESFSSVTQNWRDRGLLTPTGKVWTVKDVAQTLRAPHLAGLRVHKGEVVAEGAWEAILDRATHEALKAGKATQPAPRRSYLLTGHIFCGLCRSKMKAHPNTNRRGERLRNYWCPGKTTGTGCGKTAVRADYVEPLVELAVIGALSVPGTIDKLRRLAGGREVDAGVVEALAELKDVERELDRAPGLQAKKETRLSDRSYAAKVAALEEERKGLERRLGRLTERSKALFTYGRDPVEEWDARTDVTWRGAVIAALFEPIIVMPANGPRNRDSGGRVVFDKSRVQILRRQPGDE